MNNLCPIKLYSVTVDVETILLAFINLNQRSKKVQEVWDLPFIFSEAFWIIDVASSCVTMTAAI